MFARMSWVKPTGVQVGIGLSLVVFSFVYDLVWALYTHQSGDMATKISAYNANTFSTGSAVGGAAGFGASVFLAMATAICAGIGEETLIRGAHTAGAWNIARGISCTASSMLNLPMRRCLFCRSRCGHAVWA
jgi:hypothetical protein